MAPLVLLVLWVRRAARVTAPLACALALAGLVLLDAQSPLPLPYAIAGGLGLAAVLVDFVRMRALAFVGTLLGDIEISILLAVAAFALAVHIDGSLDGRTYPAVYVAVGLVSAFARPAASVLVVMFATAFEIAIRTFAYGDPMPLRAAPHLGFMIVFAALSVTVLRGEIARIRKASKTRLDQ